MYSYVKNQSHLWPPSPPFQGHDFHNFESKDANHTSFAFLGQMVLEKKNLLYIFQCKNWTPTVPHPTPQGHDFYNFESILQTNAST